MSASEYKEQLAKFYSLLERTEKERAAMDARFQEEISYLKKVIENLALLAKEPRSNLQINIAALSLDEAVMQIFSDERTAELAPKQVLRRLLDRGFDLNIYSNRAAYVHGCLKRLAKKKFLHRTSVQDIGSTYRFKSAMSSPATLDLQFKKVAEIGKKAQ